MPNNKDEWDVLGDRLIAHIYDKISRRFPRHINGFFMKIIYQNIRGFFDYVKPEYTLQKIGEKNEEE